MVQNYIAILIFLLLTALFWIERDQYLAILYGSEVSVTTSKIGDQSKGSAFCLVVKDDNELLAQWVAYHYHVFNMRQLFVAVHPSSSTSPSGILERFEQNFDLDVTIWNDDDYMPDWFLKRQRSNRKSSLHLVDPVNQYLCGKNATVYDPLPNSTYPTNTYFKPGNDRVEKCNDVFRQRYFYSKCGRRVRKRAVKNKKMTNSINTNGDDVNNAVADIVWTVFTDIHEYIVPNPWIDSYIRNKRDKSLNKYFKNNELQFQHHDLEAMYPEKPSAGSLWSFFQQFQQGVSLDGSKKCVMTPRILFGSGEDENDSHDSTSETLFSEGNDWTTTAWSHKNFDSLRFKYHRDHNFLDSPKGMLNVVNLPKEDLILKSKYENNSTVYWWDSFMNPHFDFHYPHKSCQWVANKGKQMSGVTKENPHYWHQPLAHYRYMGPLERYLSEEEDLTKRKRQQEKRQENRRTSNEYQKTNATSNYAIGDGNHPWNQWHRLNARRNARDTKERWWIKGWLDSFVATHGSEKVYLVLGENYATRTTSGSWTGVPPRPSRPSKGFFSKF